MNLAPNSTNPWSTSRGALQTLMLWSWWKLPTFAIHYIDNASVSFFSSIPFLHRRSPSSIFPGERRRRRLASRRRPRRRSSTSGGRRVAGMIPPPPPPPFSSSNQPKRNPRVDLPHPAIGASMDGRLAGHDGLGAADGQHGLGAAGLTSVRGAGSLGVGAAGGQHGLSAAGLLRGRDPRPWRARGRRPWRGRGRSSRPKRRRWAAGTGRGRPSWRGRGRRPRPGRRRRSAGSARGRRPRPGSERHGRRGPAACAMHQPQQEKKMSQQLAPCTSRNKKKPANKKNKGKKGKSDQNLYCGAGAIISAKQIAIQSTAPR